jgi:ribonuclease P protein component
MKRISRFTSKEISHIYSTARRAVRHPGLDILCTPATKDAGRILVITPGKVGTSPQRNLVRRRLKSIFYENKFFELGFDCVVIIKKPGVDLSFEKLGKLLAKALEVMKSS